MVISRLQIDNHLADIEKFIIEIVGFIERYKKTMNI